MLAASPYTPLPVSKSCRRCSQNLSVVGQQDLCSKLCSHPSNKTEHRSQSALQPASSSNIAQQTVFQITELLEYILFELA